MNQGRHGIKVLGLSLLAALGLMAVSAAGAQASGEFTILGHSFTNHPLGSESVEGEFAQGELLVPGLNITFNCTGGLIFGTALLGGVAHVTVLYNGCRY